MNSVDYCVMAQSRDKLTPEELARVLSNYDLGIVTGVRAFPRGAHAAAKVLVTTDRGKFMLKRRPRGKHDPYRVAFAHELQQYLASMNFPLPHLIGTRDENNSMLKIGDALYEVFEFIEAKPYQAGLVATYEAGKTLGLYLKLVRDFHPKYEPPKGHFHHSQDVFGSFGPLAERLAKTPTGQGKQEETLELVRQLHAVYQDAATAANKLGILEWETQIVHSDWHPGNLLFDREHVVAVLDYDAARIRQRVLDVANGCLQFSLVIGGRDLTKWKAETDVLRSRRFLRGCDEIDILTKAELKAIPFLMQEVLVAQAIPPILRTGTFAGLDAIGFLQVMLRKARWIDNNRGEFKLD